MKQKNTRYSFGFSQMILFFYITISLFLLLGIISTESTIISAKKVEFPSEIPTQQLAIETKIANKAGPMNLLAVSPYTETGIQAKVTKASSVSLVKQVTTEAVPTPISSFLAQINLVLPRKTLPKVNSEIRNSFSDTASPKSITTGLPVLTFTPEAMLTSTLKVTAMPTATPTPVATATPTEEPTPTATTTATATPTEKPTPTATATPKATPKSLTISTYHSINMYAKPNTDSAKKQKIPKGAKLTNVTEKGKGWLRVTYKGKTGFVHYLYTSFLEEKKIFSPTNKVIFRENQKAIISADRVNLRSHPGITSKSTVIGLLSSDTRVKAISHVEMIDDEFYGWTEIVVLETGQRGYIYEKFLEIDVTFRIDISSKDTDTGNDRSTGSGNEKTSTDSDNGNTGKNSSSDSSESNTGKDSSSSSSESKAGKKPSSGSSESKPSKKPSSSSSESKAGKKATNDEDLYCGSGASTGKKSSKTSKKTFKGVKLQYNAKYHVTSNPLNRRMGVKRYNGHRETYYSEKKLPGGGLSIPGRHSKHTADGTVRDKDGYICVATDWSYMPKGTILMTSLGPAKVYDTGCAYGTVDIYVNW